MRNIPYTPWGSDHLFPLSTREDEAYREAIIDAILNGREQWFYVFNHALYYAWQTDISLIPREMGVLFSTLNRLLRREGEVYGGYVGDMKQASAVELYRRGYRAGVDRTGNLYFTEINPCPSA